MRLPPIPYLTCTCLWVAWWLSWIALAFGTKPAKQRESFLSRLSYTFIAVLGMWLMFARRLDPRFQVPIFPYRDWAGWIGVGIAAFGFAITYWARIVLGRNWSSNVTIKENHELIRTGPYKFVRHPIYTGMVVAAAGTALALDQYRGIVAVVALWLSFTIKRLKEERFMRQQFGAKYLEYARTTGAILPRIAVRN